MLRYVNIYLIKGYNTKLIYVLTLRKEVNDEWVAVMYNAYIVGRFTIRRKPYLWRSS
jgi:hypothetical protein